LKTKSFIAALILAAAVLSQASAAPILLTAALTGGASGNPLRINLTGSVSGDYITATGYSGGLTTTATLPGPLPPTSEVSIAEGSSVSVGVNSAGNSLGLAGNNDQIGPGEFVVLDFSDHASSAGSLPGASVSFGVTIDHEETAPQGSYYVVYGFSSNNGTGTPTLLAHGEMDFLGAVTPTITTAYYNSYVIGILGDCEIDITSISATYNTPEPGTFLMGGMALIGLGLAMKKRIRKV